MYGFLGPNGAGKTTTIRIILNLVRPTSGDVAVFGVDPSRDPNVLRRVGALVESPAFYPYLTGRANLDVLARTGNCYDEARITSLLEQVNLTARARQRVAQYSLGMRQRLGLAAALLADPPLLIFDEPTNGMDPAGILEMRHFIRTLVEKQGKTVFLSSHLLAEVEQVCDRVAIIHRGELLREGAVSELLAEGQRVRVEAEPSEAAAVVLGGQWTVTSENGALMVGAGREAIPHVIRRLVEANVAVYDVTLSRASLEAYFLQVTQGETVA